MLGWIWASIDQVLVETSGLSCFHQNFPQTTSCRVFAAATSKQSMRLPGTDARRPHRRRVNGAILHAFARLFCPQIADNFRPVFKDNLANFFFFSRIPRYLRKRLHCARATGLGLIVFAYYQLARRDSQAVELRPFYF